MKKYLVLLTFICLAAHCFTDDIMESRDFCLEYGNESGRPIHLEFWRTMEIPSPQLEGELRIANGNVKLVNCIRRDFIPSGISEFFGPTIVDSMLVTFDDERRIIYKDVMVAPGDSITLIDLRYYDENDGTYSFIFTEEMYDNADPI